MSARNARTDDLIVRMSQWQTRMLIKVGPEPAASSRPRGTGKGDGVTGV
jgi:hypothetical protein